MYVVTKVSDGSFVMADDTAHTQFEGNADYAIGKCNEPFDLNFSWSVVDGIAVKGDPIEIDQSIIDAMEAEYEATKYRNERASQYPSIGDQLDALFKAGAFPEDMAAQIQAVKDAYPKP